MNTCIYIYMYIYRHRYTYGRVQATDQPVARGLGLSIFVGPREDSLRGSSIELGAIQRRFAWPFCKDGTHKSRRVANLSEIVREGQSSGSRERSTGGRESQSSSGARERSTGGRERKLPNELPESFPKYEYIYIYVYSHNNCY